MKPEPTPVSGEPPIKWPIAKTMRLLAVCVIFCISIVVITKQIERILQTRPKKTDGTTKETVPVSTPTTTPSISNFHLTPVPDPPPIITATTGMASQPSPESRLERKPLSTSDGLDTWDRFLPPKSIPAQTL